MANPLFPSLMPRVVDRLWFTVDRPCDDTEQQTQQEAEYNSWVIQLVNGTCVCACVCLGRSGGGLI